MSKFANLSLPDGYTIIILETKKVEMLEFNKRSSIGKVEQIADYMLKTKNGNLQIEKNRSGENCELSSLFISSNCPVLSIRSE